MEVHPPDGPIHSVKDFLMHLLAITVGLLIALSLEGSVEWFHHRHLVGKARENIAQEIRGNQLSLAKELKALPGEKKQLEEILEMVSDVQFGRAAKSRKDLVWTVTRLGESAWTTAFSTGAVAFMEYSEVKRYSEIYALQQLYNTTMERNLEARGQMYALLVRMNLPDKPSDAEFEQGKRALSSQLVMGEFLNEMGGQLNGVYAHMADPNSAADVK